MGRRGSWQHVQREREREERQRTNPIWRGVGCILAIVMGVLGYFFANWFLGAGLVYIPPQAINPAPPIPAFLGDGNLVRLVVAFLFMLTAFGVINFVWAILFPIQPGEYDLPTPRSSPAKRRQRKRR